MIAIVTSKNGIPIRLTEERWEHITLQHPEMLSFQEEVLLTIAEPEKILEDTFGQLLAVRTIKPSKWLIVVYREVGDGGAIVDGFIVTAFFNSRLRYLEGKAQVWP